MDRRESLKLLLGAMGGGALQGCASATHKTEGFNGEYKEFVKVSKTKYQLESGKKYLIESQSKRLELRLPEKAKVGDHFQIVSMGKEIPLMLRGPYKIMELEEDLEINVPNVVVEFEYANSDIGWAINKLKK